MKFNSIFILLCPTSSVFKVYLPYVISYVDCITFILYFLSQARVCVLCAFSICLNAFARRSLIYYVKL